MLSRAFSKINGQNRAFDFENIVMEWLNRDQNFAKFSSIEVVNIFKIKKNSVKFKALESSGETKREFQTNIHKILIAMGFERF